MQSRKTVRLNIENYEKLQNYCNIFGLSMKSGLLSMIDETEINSLDIDNRYSFSKNLKTTCVSFNQNETEKIQSKAKKYNISNNNLFNLSIKLNNFSMN